MGSEIRRSGFATSLHGSVDPFKGRKVEQINQILGERCVALKSEAKTRDWNGLDWTVIALGVAAWVYSPSETAIDTAREAWDVPASRCTV
jgi:hypothetical protein